MNVQLKRTYGTLDFHFLFRCGSSHVILLCLLALCFSTSALTYAATTEESLQVTTDSVQTNGEAIDTKTKDLDESDREEDFDPESFDVDDENDEAVQKESFAGSSKEDDFKAVKSVLQALEMEAVLNTTWLDGDDNETRVETALFEGDIMLTPGEAEDVLTSTRSRKKRKISAVKDKRWPLPIPFRFNDQPKFFLNDDEKSAIKTAMAELSSLTCITFKEVNSTYPVKPILDFKKDIGCWSYVGREKSFRFQEISTAKGCFQKGVLLHELGHAIGFWHEQSRPDRDAFVTYLDKNVKRGEEFNFKRESWGEIDNIGVPYDVGSIMHYGSTFFSKTGKDPTLETNDPLLQRDLGQRQAMSFYDVKLANLAYCRNACPNAKFSCLHDGYPDPKDCSKCRCPEGLSGSFCQKAADSDSSLPSSMHCGKHHFVDRGKRIRIVSPGFPWAYVAGTKCNWLFQTHGGMNIHLQFKPKNFMRHSECQSSNVSVCRDFVEVKYNLTFGYTGARFCCGVAPREPIVSSGNTMLLLFRAFRTGSGGFSAEIFAESCGGCDRSGRPQKACRDSKAVACRQEWYKMEYLQCPAVYRAPTNGCNQYVRRRHSRESTCHIEEEKCCPDYTLKNGFCLPPNHPGPVTTGGNFPGDITTGGSSNGNTAGSTEGVTQETPTGWAAWQPWSDCSSTCGGCGRRFRTRRCRIPKNCGGQTTAQEIQVCNTQPCPNSQAYACSRTVVEEYNCGWLKNCTRTRTVMGHCVTRCCPRYEEKKGVCQLVSTNRKRKRKK